MDFSHKYLITNLTILLLFIIFSYINYYIINRSKEKMYTRIYLDKIKEFLSTTSFSVIVGIISFLIWFSSEPFNYIFIAVYFLFSFIPLLSDDGKNYIPLFLFLLITSNKNLSFVDLNIQTWLLFSVMILSFIIFIIKNRLTFKKGDLFIPMTALILTIFVSYLYNAIKS